MLVWLIVEDLEHLKVVLDVLSDLYGHLYCLQLYGINMRLVLKPIVDMVLDVAYSIDITNNFQMLYCFLFCFNEHFLNLFVAIIFEKVNHIFIYFNELWLVPLQGFQVDKSIKIINAKSNLYSIIGSNLYLILSLPRQIIRYVDPRVPGQSTRLNQVEPVNIIVDHLRAPHLYLLPPSRSEDNWVLPLALIEPQSVTVSIQIPILICIFNFEGAPTHPFDLIWIFDFDLQDPVYTNAFLFAELSRCDHYFRFHQTEILFVFDLKLLLHGSAEVVKELLYSAIPVLGKALQEEDVVHTQVLDNV